MTVAARVESASMPQEAWDRRFMTAAFALGRRNRGRTWPNPSVGALLFRVGAPPIVVGRGVTAVSGRPHAETQALIAAGAAARGATLYVTLEPCPHHGGTAPCTDAILRAGVTRVVIPMEDPNPIVGGKGARVLRASGVEVIFGIGAEVARFEHAGHVRRILEGRPQVILKLAVSADGKTALAGRKPAAISSGASIAEAHMMRATSDAVLVGIGTVLADDPRLNCRLPGMDDHSPVRVVLDGSLRTPLDGRLVKTARQYPLWIIGRADAPLDAERRLKSAGAEVMRVDANAHGGVDLLAALRLLAARGITRVLVEGGPILSAGLLKADLVDEAVVVRSPSALGADAIPALEGMPLEALTESPKFGEIGRRGVGPDELVHLLRS
jgi:diaminohydroxyphosphoribosylaminopyrimidine deaminase/5-amino-6-(5-phosphoribosylamino)uracil reductase